MKKCGTCTQFLKLTSGTVKRLGPRKKHEKQGCANHVRKLTFWRPSTAGQACCLPGICYMLKGWCGDTDPLCPWLCSWQWAAVLPSETAVLLWFFFSFLDTHCPSTVHAQGLRLLWLFSDFLLSSAVSQLRSHSSKWEVYTIVRVSPEISQALPFPPSGL